ncbi:MAG TPA: HAD-IA family hydrolase [Steroidobacteraceae bacterium]|jgi:HAD superfamily hydrolase (TIGR01509 family)|nr:HAD-IA family hydrolase [Steroidobacteraceae bacterium]
MLKVILWDVDGTLAETERDGHLLAFNRAFEMLGVPWRWSEARYGELLAVAGGRERLLHDMHSQPLAPDGAAQRAALIERIHRLKNEFYAAIVDSGALPLRAGVAELFEDCAAAQVRMGIVTTTSTANVAALLGARLGAGWRSHFAAVVCAEQAPLKKPDPQVYLRALQSLGLAADDVLAIEDSPAGIAAARAAGISVVLVRSFYFADADIDLSAVLSAGPSLGSARGWNPLPGAASEDRIALSDLVRWHRARPARR